MGRAPPRSSRPSSARWRALKLLFALLVAVVLAAVTAYLFVWPGEDDVDTRADAVVVLAGGQDNRQPEGERLVYAGAPTLVISDGNTKGWDEANRLCESGEAVCSDPGPYSTQGEARWIAAEAERQGWDSLVVVTSSYHVRRARVIVERCFDGELSVVGSDPSVANRILGIAWEWPKSLYYLAWNRECSSSPPGDCCARFPPVCSRSSS